MNQRVIYFDVTTLINTPLNDGIRRATRSMIESLMDFSLVQKSVILIPISFLDSLPRKNYSIIRTSAGNLLTSVLNHEIVEFKTGDILFVPAYDIFRPEYNINFHNFPAGIKTVSVIYDLLPVLNSGWFPDDTIKPFESTLNNQLLYSDEIIVNSQKVKKDLIEFITKYKFKTDIEKIHVLKLTGLSQQDISSKAKFSAGALRKKSPNALKLLMVGTVEPRKGHREVLEILLKNLDKFDFHLTVVGRLGWKVSDEMKMMKKLTHLKPKNFTWIKNASDDQLNELYDTASLCLAASFDEGYGLPVVEALNRNLPVLARKIEVFNEVSQGATATFGDGADFVDLENALMNLTEAFSIAKQRQKFYIKLSNSDFRINLQNILVN